MLPAAEDLDWVDEWTRSYVADEVVQAGYQSPVLLGQAVLGRSSVVACEATRRGAAAMFAFGFEDLGDGDRMPSGAIRAAYRRGHRGVSRVQGAGPWLAFGAWSDLHAGRRVIVGRVLDPTTTICRVITSAGTQTLPVRRGLVIGWVDAARDVRFEIS